MKATRSLTVAVLLAVWTGCGDDGVDGGAGGTASQASTTGASSGGSKSTTVGVSTSASVSTSSASNAVSTTASASSTATTTATSSTTASTTAASTTAATTTSSSSSGGGLLPDLTVNAQRLIDDLQFDMVDSASDPCLVGENCLAGNGPRLVVRFSTRTENIGPVDFVIGDPATTPGFVYSPCHDHFHYYDYASYRVVDGAGNVVATGHKQGFALIDIGQIDPNDPNTPPFPTYGFNWQGITRGWYDEYSSGLQCQWIDITDVAPGSYFLEVEVNPSQSFAESDYTNNVATIPLVVPDCVLGCAHLDTPCTLGVCVPGTGCEAQPRNDGGVCDDFSFCTVGETCSAGVCGGGTPRECAPPGGCFVGQCDDASASCLLMPGNDGLSCDDGSPCTDGTTCAAGICGGGAPANDGLSCDDGASCTAGETCTGGTCGGGAGPTIYFSDDFSDNAAGWGLGPTWEIGPAIASIGADIGGNDPENDHSPTADDGVAGVVIGGLVPAVIHGMYYLESPAFDTSLAAGPVVLGYQRWLNSDYDPWMVNTVEVYDGTAWIEIWSSIDEPAIVDGAWTYFSHDITAFASPSTRVRFGYRIGSVSSLYDIGGWTIDDVIVASLSCP